MVAIQQTLMQRGLSREEKLALLQQMRIRLQQLDANRYDAEPAQKVTLAQSAPYMLHGADELRMPPELDLMVCRTIAQQLRVRSAGQLFWNSNAMSPCGSPQLQ